MLKRLLTIIGAMFFFPAISLAVDLYVQSAKAPIYLAPDAGSGKLAEVKKGTKINGISEKGYWYNVSYKNKKGWMYKFMVKKEPPVDSTSLYSKLRSLFRKYELFSDRSRRRSSSYSATAAARGLKAKRKRFADQYRLDYTALGKMEASEASDNDALKFISKGVGR